MPSVAYRFVEPFIETVDGVESERVPVTLHARKWQPLHEDAYRLWLRAEVTDFGEMLVRDGPDNLDDSIETPAWYDAASHDEIAWWIDRINAADIPATALEEAVGARGIPDVESVENTADGAVDITMRLLAPAVPVRAGIGPFLASFDPRRD